MSDPTVALAQTGQGTKRGLDNTNEQTESTVKKICVEESSASNTNLDTSNDDKNKEEIYIKKRKVAMLLSYSGQGYLGMQRNPGYLTIEGELLTALLKGGFINQETYEKPQQSHFQRAARTDKGVSACRSVVSLKLPDSQIENVVSINQYLPETIRVMGVRRVTKKFNCKNNCDARTYIYVMPTFAFAPVTEITSEDYRISEKQLDEVNNLLQNFKGTRNYHNFTSRKNPLDPSANRYMIEVSCGSPFVREGIEFVVIKIKGQSFMMHQIRKMVGLIIAIIRGLASVDAIKKAWTKDRIDIPRAPGLGLVLEEVHYTKYNKRYASDGIHCSLSWEDESEQVEAFKEKFIYKTIVKTEKEEKSMLTWLATLPLHTFDVREEGAPQPPPNALRAAGHRAGLFLEETDGSEDESKQITSNSLESLTDDVQHDLSTVDQERLVQTISDGS